LWPCKTVVAESSTICGKTGSSHLGSADPIDHWNHWLDFPHHLHNSHGSPPCPGTCVVEAGAPICNLTLTPTTCPFGAAAFAPFDAADVFAFPGPAVPVRGIEEAGLRENSINKCNDTERLS